ncbi:PH domain-containing protein [Nocardioides sp. YIM 152315]|uniref:PH domain-containing protein n=1 Tax=Nocardioides sp. YIM 152315 TaxID=3031760 RepID=UPI0023DC8E46|nr:PH domain-containing protein [Nocardioides sp. YIM 152315]MDF1602962.1 PH domain-containing protein [Nocardioides sp. YIM 152315]
MTDRMGDWQRLDPRMLLIYPVRELVRFLPALVAIFVAGTAAGRTDWWHGLGVAIPVALGVLRYFTTYFRVTDTRVELRRGLVNRHLLSTPLDRVRTVDVTASLTHRLLGLTSVRIGTGTASTDDDDHLDLDGLPVGQARRLRTDLLRLDETGDEPVRTDRVVVRFDPAWVRFAPLTTTGLVLAGGALGLAAQATSSVGGFDDLDAEGLVDGTSGWSVWLAIPVGLVVLLVVVSALAIGGYVVANWGFTLTHTGPSRRGAWHLRRGLLTTRETTVDDERVSGVSVADPLGLRLARGARVSAIVTGLDRSESGSALLAPPCPRPVVDQVAAEVLGTAAPLTVPLTSHGPRARGRRYTRALGPTVLVVGVVALLVGVGVLAPWWLATLVALPAACLLARDRAHALGHALADGHLVARSGSLARRREALAVPGVIGWNLRSSWFQRRAGLTTLVATTAGGPQAVTVLDVPVDAAVALAHDSMPELVRQFVVSPHAGATAPGRSGL